MGQVSNLFVKTAPTPFMSAGTNSKLSGMMASDVPGRDTMPACGSGNLRASFGHSAAGNSGDVKRRSIANACETIACGPRSGFGMPIAFHIVALRSGAGNGAANFGSRFRARDSDVAPHPAIEFRGTASIQTGEGIMASRQQQKRRGWNVSGSSRFLWTDVGALAGLIAVAGFAVYRNLF